MKRLVTYAKLHGGDAFIPGVGGIGSTLPPSNKTLNLKMYYTPEGLLLNVNGKEGMVPLANLQIVMFAPEDPTPAKAVA